MGGSVGGLVLGGFASLLGLDALRLFTGASPMAITGAAEGAVMGLTVGFGLIVARKGGIVFAALGPAVVGAVAGIAIVAMGGTLMAGSLTALAANFPETMLAPVAGPQNGWVLLSGAFEGAVFAAGTVMGMFYRRSQPGAA